MIFLRLFLFRIFELGLLFLVYRYVLSQLQQPFRMWMIVLFAMVYVIYIASDTMDMRSELCHEKALKKAL